MIIRIKVLGCLIWVSNLLLVKRERGHSQEWHNGHRTSKTWGDKLVYSESTISKGGPAPIQAASSQKMSMINQEYALNIPQLGRDRISAFPVIHTQDREPKLSPGWYTRCPTEIMKSIASLGHHRMVCRDS